MEEKESKWERLRRRHEIKEIVDEIPKLHINTTDLGREEKITMPMVGDVIHFPDVGIITKNAIVAFEDFEPGTTITWCESENGVAIVLQGQAEIKYSLRGTHWTEVKTMTVSPGDAYVVVEAGYMKCTVTSSNRYRHLWVSTTKHID